MALVSVKSRDIDWSKVRRMTVVPYGDDVDGWVLVKDGGRLVLPTGEVGAGEDPVQQTLLRLPLGIAGFRQQGCFPFAVDNDHVMVWCPGARYQGARPHATVEWWHGDATDAARLLAQQGDVTWSELMLLADQARRQLTRSFTNRTASCSKLPIWRAPRRRKDRALAEATKNGGALGLFCATPFRMTRRFWMSAARMATSWNALWRGRRSTGPESNHTAWTFLRPSSWKPAGDFRIGRTGSGWATPSIGPHPGGFGSTLSTPCSMACPNTPIARSSNT